MNGKLRQGAHPSPSGEGGCEAAGWGAESAFRRLPTIEETFPRLGQSLLEDIETLHRLGDD